MFFVTLFYISITELKSYLPGLLKWRPMVVKSVILLVFSR